MRSSIPLLSKAPAPSSSSSNTIDPPSRPPRTSSLSYGPSTTTQTQTHSTPHANQTRIPSIRLITATPSATGVSSSEASSSFARSLEESWAAHPMPSPSLMPTGAAAALAPKEAAADTPAKRRLVPKKSKLSLLSMGKSLSSSSSASRDKKSEERAKDLSDVVRRVGLAAAQVGDSSYSTGRGGFEIYVDPSHVDPDIGEIVLVKKKSRVGLDGVPWGGAMGEVTNVSNVMKDGGVKEGGGLLKVKSEEKEGGKEKWWATIGRGRKDSKDKDKKEKENLKISHKPIEYIHDPHPRSKTPEPFTKSKSKSQAQESQSQSQSRARFNSLDSGMLLNPKLSPIAGGGASATPSIGFASYLSTSNASSSRPVPPMAKAQAKIVPMPSEEDEENQEAERRSLASSLRDQQQQQQRQRERSGSVASSTIGGMLAPPGAQGDNQGSIALRAMRSVRSLARMGSWAQLKGMPGPVTGAEDEVASGTVKEKKGKKSKKEKGVDGEEEKEKKGKKKSTKKGGKKEKEQEKTGAVRHSTSSFEVGALTASPGGPSPVASEFLSSSGYTNSNSNSDGNGNGKANAKTLGAKKGSMLLGLGLPSTMRLPSAAAAGGRVGSSASSMFGGGPAAPAAAAANAPCANANANANPNTANANANTVNDNRLSVESAYTHSQHQHMARPNSVLSSGSSLRPLSTTSTNSRLSSSGSSVVSGASVRWDEQGLETVRELRKREREARAASGVGDEEKDRERKDKEEEKKERRSSRESRRSSEGRRRTALMDVFPEVKRAFDEVEIGSEMIRDDVVDENVYNEEEERRERESVKRFSYPILTIEEATSDGHGRPCDWGEVIEGYESESVEGHGQEEGAEVKEEKKAVDATPVKKARARPLSEQMLGRSRPKPMYEDDEGVLSILDAATNDLALLINNLDLQATPSTPDMTPLRPSASMSPSPTPVSTLEKAKAYNGSPTTTKKRRLVAESPLGAKSVVKNSSAASVQRPDLFRQMSASSISSLRPYAQSRGYPAKASAVQPPPSTVASATAANGNGNANPANASLIAKQIAPWATLMKGLSPVKEKLTPSPSSSLRLKASAPTPPATGTFRPGHKRTMTPAPEPEPEVVLQPLRPARSRLVVKAKSRLLHAPSASPEAESKDDNNNDSDGHLHPRAPSSLTFGTFGSRGRSSASASVRGSDEFSGSLTPVFKRIHEFESQTLHKASPSPSSRSPLPSPSPALLPSLMPNSNANVGLDSSRSSRSSKGSRSSYGSQITSHLSYSLNNNNPANEEEEECRIPITRETRRVLGLSGTMGGSDVSMYAEEVDVSDPDSDVPDELRNILEAAGASSGAAEEEREETDMEVDDDHIDSEMDMEIGMVMEAARSRTPVHPPSLALDLPVFRAALIDAHDIHHNISFPSSPSASDAEDDTKKSFDFTGELRRLNESGGSDRRSFVEQLENAFRTPAKVDLRYDFGVGVELMPPPPPVPMLPVHLGVQQQEEERQEEEGVSSGSASGGGSGSAGDADGESSSSSGFDAYSASRIVDVQFPSMNTNLNTKSPLVEEVHSQDPEPKSHFDMFSSPALKNLNADERIVDVQEPTVFLQDSSNSNSNGSSSIDIPISPSPIPRIKRPHQHQRQLASSTSSSSSRTSETSEGELNTSFRFGGLPRSESSASLPKDVSPLKAGKPLTLSDIIPPPAHARSLSGLSGMGSGIEMDSFMLDGLEDDSVLKSIYAKIVAAPPAPLRVASDSNSSGNAPQPQPQWRQDQQQPASVLEMERQKRRSIYKASSRPTSGISFEGFSSFEEVRRGFEFHDERPSFYPPAEVSSSSYSYTTSAAAAAYAATSAAASAAVAAASRRAPHRRHESVFSIASVSSFGHVINPGSADPFEFGLPSLQERPSSETEEDMTGSLSIVMSDNVEDTFAYLANKPRRRVESDASSFYFQPQQRGGRGHRRRESNMSVSSQAPPISLYNRSFGHGHHRRNDSNTSFSFSYYHNQNQTQSQHRRNDSSASASSVAMSYIKHGANGGISAWARHRKDQSVDSVMSDFSGMHLGRPGIGDKMFDTTRNPGADNGPLSAIDASPPESANASDSQRQFSRYGHGRRGSFDSLLDDDDDEERRSSMMADDSLFEQTGYRSSVSDSVFGDHDDLAHQLGLQRAQEQGQLFPPNQFRPLSVLSRNSVHSPMKDDDTMISMLGGGHVRRRSVGSIIEASPCVRVEKRKHSAVQGQGPGLHMYKGKEQYESPNKARIVEKPSIASTSSFQFGGERMIKAQRGLLERQSLEEHCLVADGEDLSTSYHAVPVFSRPGPTTRSRSSTCTSSSGGDTPPLSASDGSSISGGSQSSIDLSHINIALSNATHPVSTVTRNNVTARTRARARGAGHRRRYSKSHVSRSSVYETIEEEMLNSAHTSPAHSSVPSKKSSTTSPTTRQAVFIVDEDTASLGSYARPEESVWDDERGIVALRKYYALRDEAQNTVTESRRQWSDTPFSIFAIQSFQAPGSPAGMQALLQHSVQNYGPLPSELRPHRVRSRTSSRPSPYPQGRTSKMTLSPEKKRSTSTLDMQSQRTPVLQQVHLNQNTRTNKMSSKDAVPSLGALKPFSPLVMHDNDDDEPRRENAYGLAPNVRPRVGSTARRTALGWSKRSTGPGAGKSSTDQKENAVGGVITTPGDNLRLNRPRPRGRPTPGGRTPVPSTRPPVPNSTNRPIRI